MRKHVSVLVAFLVLACQAKPSFAASTDALTIEAKIPLGQVEGRIDHLAVDLGRRRLFVAELGNNSVGIVDLNERKVIGRIFGLKQPQGVGYVPASDALFVANAEDGTVHRYRGSVFTPLGTASLGDDADNVRVDGQTSQVFVGYGKGALAVLDPASGARTGEIRLPAHPESFQLEPNGTRIFVNVPEARQIAVTDRAVAKQVAKWGIPDAGANFPMALDDAGQLLLVVYRKPPLLAVFDAGDGKLVARLPTCGDADDVFFDAKRQRAYVSCGEGSIDVVQRTGNAYRKIGRVPTVPGARTSLFIADLQRLFVAVRSSGAEHAAIWVFRPADS
jgi:hypothetical protein